MTRFVPKPMLPLGERPVMDFVLREALDAGCDPVVVVVPPGASPLKRYLREFGAGGRVRTAEQSDPRGLGDALRAGFESLPTPPSRVAMLLPDNVVLEGSGVLPLLEADAPVDRLVFGVIEVDRRSASYFGNSGGFEGVKNAETGRYRIDRLRAKGEGTFREASERWPSVRTVGRALLPAAFFRAVRQASPDPATGEIDDVPVYREMLQSSPALGVSLSADLHDMGEPERYLRLCAHLYRRRSESEAPSF